MTNNPVISKTNLPDIDDVEPVTTTDQACIDEIREVLKRHGAERRFGLCLLHDHFPIGDDEVLLEECDVKNRTLTSRPVKKTEIDGNAIGTMWRLDADANITTFCTRYCHRVENPGGKVTHDVKHKSILGPKT